MEDQEQIKEQLIPELTLSSPINAKRKETKKNFKTTEEEVQAVALPKIPDVDVYPLILNQLKDFLEQNGYQELSSPAGKSALGSAVLDPTEIKIPIMDDYQVWHLLKSDPKGSMIPVILIKALDEDTGKIEEFKAGYFENFSEPLQRLELVSRQKAHPELQGLQKLLDKQKIKLEQKIAERAHVEEELKKHKANLDELTAEHTQKIDTLDRLLKERTTELSEIKDQLAKEIRERKSTEAALDEKAKELQFNTEKLEGLYVTLEVLLTKRENDRAELEEKVSSNVKHLLIPHFETLKKRAVDQEFKDLLDILEINLKNITSPFSHKLSSTNLGLTPTEIKVANLVKESKQIKEIAEMMGVSHYAVELHRFNIRKKLGLKSRKVNLQSYLLSLP